MGRRNKPNEYIIMEDYSILKIFSRKNGEFEIPIDTEEIDKIKLHSWTINKYKSNKGKYEKYYIASGKGLLLHRYIMNAEKGQVVDHISNDSLDNRKTNLRLCTQKENGENNKLHKNNKSGHKGVMWYYYNDLNKWMAYICVDLKRITLGYFNEYEDAVNAREKAEEMYFGDYSYNKSQLLNI